MRKDDHLPLDVLHAGGLGDQVMLVKRVAVCIWDNFSCVILATPAWAAGQSGATATVCCEPPCWRAWPDNCGGKPGGRQRGQNRISLYGEAV